MIINMESSLPDAALGFISQRTNTVTAVTVFPTSVADILQA